MKKLTDTILLFTSFLTLGLITLSSASATIIDGSYSGGNTECEESFKCSASISTTSGPTTIINTQDSLLDEDQTILLLDEMYKTTDNSPVAQKLADYFGTSTETIQSIVRDLYQDAEFITLENIGKRI